MPECVHVGQEGWGAIRLLKVTPTFLASSDVFVPVLQILFYLGHELVGDCSVDQAVVVAQRQMNDGADGNGVIAIFVGDDQGLLGDAAHAHDGGVWLIDDREAEYGTELARVGDGEGGSFDVFRLELLGAGALAEIGDAALQA